VACIIDDLANSDTAKPHRETSMEYINNNFHISCFVVCFWSYFCVCIILSFLLVLYIPNESSKTQYFSYRKPITQKAGISFHTDAVRGFLPTESIVLLLL